jgi:hypothetical protein
MKELVARSCALSAESLSLSGDLQIISTNRLSEAVGGEGEFRASFSGLVTITALTGATGVGYLLSELVTTVSGLDGGLDFSLTHGDEVLSDHIDSDNDQVLSTRFTFGKPFPLAAEITASLSSNFAFGIQGTLDIQNLFVLDLDSPEGVGIPSTITYVESPVPEISTSWLVVAGLGLLPIRRALRNR